MFFDEARQQQITRRTPAIAGVLLLAAGIGLAPYSVAQQPPQSRVIAGHVSYSHTSPPTSGVKLLEDIFLRVRSTPQIAMARNLMKQQVIAQEPEDKLKIRPKPSSPTTRMLPAPALQIVPSASGTAIGALAGGGGGSAQSLYNEADSSINQTSLVPQMVRGGRTFPIQAASNKPAAPGLWESQSIAMSEGRTAQEPKPLSQTVPNLLGALNTISRVQDYGNSLRARQVQAAAPPMLAEKADRTIAYKDADKYAADGELATDELRANKRRDEATSFSMNARARNKATWYTATKEEAAPAASVRGVELDAKKAKLAMADIALLPPNVVTGIPLVRLGSSENQANSALQAIGSMKQQKVNKWTVWSWSRPQSRNGTSLQLYMRNGLLDAMRIFDPTLIGQDFGVNLGDSLGRVKEKFGEPAFILQEPGPGAGQNYVYPISQIGFQLARPQPGEQPRVVSVLIFNVK